MLWPTCATLFESLLHSLKCNGLLPLCLPSTTAAAVVDAVANWDWATIAVFTCQAGCSSRETKDAGAAAALDSNHQQQQRQCEVFTEAVFVVNEQDCYIALPPPVPGVGAGAAPAAGHPAAAAAAVDAAAVNAAADVAAVATAAAVAAAEEDSFEDEDAYDEN
jgi:hypothetical protein